MNPFSHTRWQTPHAHIITESCPAVGRVTKRQTDLDGRRTAEGQVAREPAEAERRQADRCCTWSTAEHHAEVTPATQTEYTNKCNKIWILIALRWWQVGDHMPQVSEYQWVLNSHANVLSHSRLLTARAIYQWMKPNYSLTWQQHKYSCLMTFISHLYFVMRILNLWRYGSNHDKYNQRHRLHQPRHTYCTKNVGLRWIWRDNKSSATQGNSASATAYTVKCHSRSFRHRHVDYGYYSAWHMTRCKNAILASASLFTICPSGTLALWLGIGDKFPACKKCLLQQTLRKPYRNWCNVEKLYKTSVVKHKLKVERFHQ